MSIIQDIYDVFINFFGGSNVDLQECDTSDTDTTGANYMLLIYWDTVKISNEHNKSIDIWGLYSRILLDNTGRLVSKKPHFIRDCYNDDQWKSHFLHSHVQGRYHTEDFFEWATNPCLGTGPIITTINKLGLSEYYYTDMDYWFLFCVELDKYVHVESLSGVPYMRLEYVGKQSRTEYYDLTPQSSISPSLKQEPSVNNFISYILKNPGIFKFRFVNNKYDIGNSFIDIVKGITKEFINWYYSDNKHVKSIKLLIYKNILSECYIRYNCIYFDTELTSSIESNIGRSLNFTFKGIPITMKRKDTVIDNNKTPILNLNIINTIIYKILTLVNFKYGQSTEETDTNGAIQRFV